MPTVHTWRPPPGGGGGRGGGGAEVSALLALMGRVLATEVAALATTGVRLRFVGELERLPEGLQAEMRRWVGVRVLWAGRSDAVAEWAGKAAPTPRWWRVRSADVPGSACSLLGSPHPHPPSGNVAPPSGPQSGAGLPRQNSK